MPLHQEYIIEAENLRRSSSSNESILLSVKVSTTMSHDDHFHYGCFGRPSRRSPNVAGNTNVNPNQSTARRGFFSSGGRTVLPPLHLPFRTSRSPDPNYVTNQFGQQDATHTRGDYNVPVYDQPVWPANTSHPSSTPGQFPSDPRYSTSASNYPPSTSRTPPMNYDSRTMPLSSTHQGPYYPQAGEGMMTGSHIRSQSSTGYPTQYSYTTQSQQAAYYSNPSDPRSVPSSMGGLQYDPTTGAPIPRRTSLSVDRTVPRLSQHGMPPYARAPPVIPSSFDQESVAEPVIKKKRKRADAEQLKVLNETYNRTAFPSTEERIELAKKLGMSARSVQIWFQNKRQAMRQSSRQNSTTAPPVATEPFTAGPAPSSGISPSAAGHGSPYGLPPVGQMGSISMAGQMHAGRGVDAYGRPNISPSPSSQYRGRSYDDHDRRTPQRSPSRTR
ncbi:homeobox-domain-containing protein [Trametopsis cervina]|nr:homeobox-domain-containing protein [Trametopsis cervina]